jgi:exopolysaccharide biosynthesis polyprenyl glycosylphosphotransferase
MISGAPQSEVSQILDSDKAFKSGEPRPLNHELPDSRDRRKQKRQQVRRTPLSSRPSLFSFRSAWIALDFSLCVAAVTITRIDVGNPPVSFESVTSCLLAGLPFALLVLVIAQPVGLYRAGVNDSSFITLVNIVQAVLPAGLGIHWLQKRWGASVMPLDSVAWELTLTGVAMFCARLLWRRHRDYLYKSKIAQRNFLIVGADRTGHDVCNYLSSLQHVGYRFQGFVSMYEQRDDLQVVHESEIVGLVDDVIHLAQSRFVDEIIFSKRPTTPGVLSCILRQAQPLGISIRLIPSLTETLVDRTDVEYIGALPTIAVFTMRQRPIAQLLKRAIDVSIAAVALIALLPIFLAIALAIMLQSSGPALYLSKRVGHKGRIFTCFKFRTMVMDAAAMQESLEHRNERNGAFFKISNDPRVTTIGRALRKYSLDELPQLWNVIRGDMSLVGPRPPLASETMQYNLRELRRLDAVPGITGLWQVKARQDPSFEQTVALDRNYINNWSLLLDFSILLQTVKVVFRGTGS